MSDDPMIQCETETIQWWGGDRARSLEWRAWWVDHPVFGTIVAADHDDAVGMAAGRFHGAGPAGAMA